jgi:pimeloyl-ACP methyl ester carboxylesterase
MIGNQTLQETAMPKINRDGINIYYEVHGEGPALILTHGYSSTSAMWKGQIEAFSQHHRLVLWDMRGHGQSDYPQDPQAYSEALTVGDIAALLDAVGAKRAIVGGLSLGGYMSLAFHRAHPERVSALLIVDTGPGFKKDDARDAWNRRALDTADRFEREGLEVLKAASRERSTVSHRDASGLARAARGMLTQRDAGVIEALPGIRVPSLVVVGADDTPFLAASDYMAAKIPGAGKVVIPGAGHAVNIDQPQAFIDAVLPFLDSLKTTA